MESCAHCLWDISRDDSGRWRLAWGGSPDDSDPYRCDGWGEGRHEPGVLKNCPMVLTEPVVRVSDVAQFFATRDSARRLIAGHANALPDGTAVIFDWSGVEAVTGAFMAEFVKRSTVNPRAIAHQGMNDDIRAAWNLAHSRTEADRHERPASMLQPTTFADDDDRVRQVPMKPVDEAEDVW